MGRGSFQTTAAAAGEGSSSTRDIGLGGMREALDSAPEEPLREKPAARASDETERGLEVENNGISSDPPSLRRTNPNPASAVPFRYAPLTELIRDAVTLCTLMPSCRHKAARHVSDAAVFLERNFAGTRSLFQWNFTHYTLVSKSK